MKLGRLNSPVTPSVAKQSSRAVALDERLHPLTQTL